ncbi:MAG: type II toxin-antitoxin system HicB family antitoxin [Planctomycetaceae bacterium]|nr:type II toxin-antitoxin system HicB family antitoxin [Planctomycetaceae bacterium]
MVKKIWVCIEKADSNYGAYAPEVPGCISTGATIEETRANIIDALTFHLEDMDEKALAAISGDFPLAKALESEDRAEDEYYALVEILIADSKVGV